MDDSVSVEAVLCTGELQRRSSRTADFATENGALVTLVQTLADAPDSVLQTMVEVMLATFHVGSAGCSVLVDQGAGARFFWPAIAGAWQTHIGEGSRRDFSPCGDVLDREAPVLFKQPQRRYHYLRDVSPGIEECLLVPFHVGGIAVGTVWLFAHDESRKFDMEDLRQLLSLSRFAASAYQATTSSRRMREQITGHQAFEVELKQATLTANQASISKSDFLTNISHELRTPLSSILGHAQVMELGCPLTDAQKHSVAQIKKGGWYLAELINEILDLAQIEAGKLTVRLEPVPLAEVMLECQAMIEPLAKPLAIKVRFPSLDSAVFVVGDRTRIKQVLINLLSNAIKYNKHGGKVTVECLNVADRLRISVKDTGEGLDAGQLSQLFQLFNRLGQDEHKVSGSGIGLVMTKRLTELMGGAVGVESTVGTGSTFWIELNRALQPKALVASALAPYAPAVASNVTVKTLLYVEDNPANLMIIQELMAHRQDIRLLCARDGNRGLALARANRPDAILLDLRLPDISGMEVAAILAAEPATAHIPVIAFSANAMPHAISQAMDAGFFQYITKPFKVSEFMETLDKALGL